ncbi:MAG: winged helix-turn-helix domain-containing protein [Promethearchaeota archaeon]
MISKKSYRSSNMIILNILETLLRKKANPYDRQGIVKSNLIKKCKLKTTTAEKYLKKMEEAGYISSHEEAWGDRTIILYKITELGKERYEWFVKINLELEL